MTKYVLDANVFIEAFQRYYAFDIAPSFWNLLVSQAMNGRVISIDRVKDELIARDDELSVWAYHEFSPYFMPSTTDQQILQNYGILMNWAQAQKKRFKNGAIRDFSQSHKADAWLIAYVMSNPGHILVTEEKYDPNNRKKILIPVVCREFHVPWIDTFDMLRRINATIQFHTKP